MNYRAVIAAAGLSSRMHEFKPMMKLGNSTIIDNVIQNLQNAGCKKIVVVTGYRTETMKKHLHGSGVHVCENKDFAKTKMLDSVKLGLAELHTDEDTEKWDWVFITPGDVPLVSPETMQKMMQEAEANQAGIIRPSFAGKAGHPVLLCRNLAKLLSEYEGEGGLRGFLTEHSSETAYITVADRGILADADTKEDYKYLRRLEMEKKSEGRLWCELDIQVAKAGTILTAESAQFLEMIDHTGSVQSACGCMHMSYSKGWKMLKQMEKELGYPLTIRMAGGEGGGGSILSERGRKLLMTYRRFTDMVSRLATGLFEEMFTEELHDER